MKNEITVTIEFYFKGIQHLPSMVLDLDKAVSHDDLNYDSLYAAVAHENNIDLYSYEYDVMEAQEIDFSNATGLAADFLHGTQFDMEGFEQAWRKEQNLKVLRQIAKEHMDIDNLDQHPKLQAALTAAYQKGKSSRN